MPLPLVVVQERYPLTIFRLLVMMTILCDDHDKVGIFSFLPCDVQIQVVAIFVALNSDVAFWRTDVVPLSKVVCFVVIKWCINGFWQMLGGTLPWTSIPSRGR